MKMKFTHLVKIALLLVSPGVFAATIMPEDTGTNDLTATVMNGETILTNIDVISPEEPTILDTYAFSSDVGIPVFISTSSIEHSISLPPPGPGGDMVVFLIEGLTATLKDPSGAAVVGATGSEFTADIVGGLVYTVEVTGTATGIAGGAYSVAVAAVPLPPAILLMGSAIMGLAAVGRRNRKEVS